MHDENKHEDGNPGYETRDVPAKFVIWSLSILAGATVISTILVLGMFLILRNRPDTVSPQPSPFATERTLPPEPRLQALPPADLAKYNAEMDQKLNTYGWVNKAAGTAHIPVDVALDIIAERGLPYGKENHHPKPNPALPAHAGAGTASNTETPDASANTVGTGTTP